MDKFWSVGSMPIGLFLCFAPIVIAWIIAANNGQPAPRDEKKR